MRKDDFCYEQSKKRESLPNWKNKKKSHFDQKRKGLNSNKRFGNKSQNNHQRIDFKNKVPLNTTTPKGRDIPNNFVKSNEHKEPVKCWECQGPHYSMYCSNRKVNFSNVHTIHEEEIIGDVENEIPRINGVLENR